MKSFSAFFFSVFCYPALLLLLLFPLAAAGQSQNLSLHDERQTHNTLADTLVEMTGRSELHLVGSGDPFTGSLIHLNSPDAWLFFPNVQPSTVNTSGFRNRILVNGATAVVNTNVRIAQYDHGTVVIPHSSNFEPLTVYSEPGFQGESRSLRTYTYYNTAAALGAMQNNISSFRLKRGYMATVAQQAGGGGISQVYVAQDGDIEVDFLPAELDNAIGFVRVFPWRWVSQKGFAGGSATERAMVNSTWWYDWDNATNSILNMEYVPMRHNSNWNAYSNINNKQNSTHALGFNEPDRPDQADMTVQQALDQWPNLMASGLRLGSPSPSDAGPALDWLYEFMDEADARNYRVDYVAVHYYKNDWTATQMHNWLRGIHERTGRPLWITEWNNGCNWTTPHPTYASNAARVAEYLDMLASAPFVERYSFYQWCTNRELIVNGNLTPAGEVYRDFQAPSAYHQELPRGVGPDAHYTFDGHVNDQTGSGNTGMLVGFPKFMEGPSANTHSLQFAGDGGFVQLPPSVGASADFTFAGWVKWDGGSSNQRIFALGNNSTNRYVYLTPRSGGNTLRFTIRNGTAAEQQINAPALTQGEWTHVAVTISGSTGRLYVNGSLAASNTGMTINPRQVDAFRNYLGRDFYNGPGFTGALADVYFLGHALTGTQIADLPAVEPREVNYDAIHAPEAFVLQPYGSLLSGLAGVPDNGAEWVTATKLEGPSWLTVTPGGHLTGLPELTDAGVSRGTIRVVDEDGAVSIIRVTLPVSAAPGIVARYAFEQNVRSSVGNAHAITVGNPGYVAGIRGDYAVSLNGSSQYVQLPEGVAHSAEITIASWVYWTGGTSNWQRIFDFGNGTSNYLFLTPRSGATGNRFRFGIRAGGGEQILEGPATLPGNQWVHVAVTLGGGTGRLYLNGGQVDSRAISIAPSDIRPASNYIGNSQWPDPLFNGRIDDFVIFNQVLTTSEINQLMNDLPPVFESDPILLHEAAVGEPYSASISGMASDPNNGGGITYTKIQGPSWLNVAADGTLSGTPTTWNEGTNQFVVRATGQSILGQDATLRIRVPPSPDLVAHYEFLGNTQDSAGSFDANASGSVSYVSSIFDEAIRLAGDGGHVVLPSGVANRTHLTIAARVRWNGGGIWQRVFDFGNNTSQYIYLTPRSGGETMRFGITTGGSATQQILETSILPTGEWVHIAVTLGDNIGRMYINGVLVDSRGMTLTPSAFNPINNYIGRSQWPADPYFNGLVDDFRLYSRVLTGEEIGEIALSHFGAVILEDPTTGLSFGEWAASIPFPPGMDGPHDDPDGDGLPNGLEYLFGSDPLVPGSATLPSGELVSGADLGEATEPGKTYLSFQVRVLKDRDGVTLVPQAASSLEELSHPNATENAVQAGSAKVDGDFEIFTYYFALPIEDSVTGQGFIRLQVEVN